MMLTPVDCFCGHFAASIPERTVRFPGTVSANRARLLPQFLYDGDITVLPEDLVDLSRAAALIEVRIS